MAIVVALSALMLMAFGALAVDLGNAWARKRAIQTSADLAALAGAGGLPSTLDARRVAIDYLRRNPVQGASLAACTLTTWSTPCWDNDSDETNGEIEFFDDTDNDGRVEFDANHDGNRVDTEQVTSASATVIRVVPPGHKVDFGLAGAVGFDSVDVT